MACLTMLVGVIAGIGCGSSNEPDCSMVTMQGLDPNQMLASLSQAQRGQLCDVTACEVGGYGTHPSCRGGSPVTIAASQAKCVASTATNPACSATVQDLYDCIAALRISPCVSTLFGDPACAAATDYYCETITAAALWSGMAAAPISEAPAMK